MENDNRILEAVLRECRAKAPAPFYPSLEGKEKFDRPALDAALDRLRLGGLLEITPWESGRGQGYKLTPAGEEVVQSPRSLARLGTHGVEPPRPEPVPAEAEAGRPMNTWEKGEAIRAVLVGGHPATVTKVLLFLNIVVFLLNSWLALNKNMSLEEFMNGGKVVSDPTGLGMIHADLALRGEWWRLLSYQFVHIGGMHLLFNMLFLYNVGPMVETMFGHVRFLVLYLIAGVGGGTAMVLADSGGAGASGSLCGIFAAMAVFLLWNRQHLPPQALAATMRQIAFNAMIIVFISMLPNVSGSGHLGGAIAGAAVCIPLIFTRFGIGWQRMLGWLAVAAVAVGCVILLQSRVSDEDRERQRLQHAATQVSSIASSPSGVRDMARICLGRRNGFDPRHSILLEPSVAGHADSSAVSPNRPRAAGPHFRKKT